MPDVSAVAAGNVIEMKKPHACGSLRWLVERTGADYGLKCLGCSHRIMIARPDFERRFKKTIILK